MYAAPKTIRMKVSAALSIACAISVSSALGTASVYVLDSDLPRNHAAPSISSAHARVWLANRLALSSSHELGDIDQETISLLNQFSHRNKPAIFSSPEPVPRKVVILEGIENPNGTTT